MAITTAWFGLGLLDILEAPRDLEAVTNKLALATSSYTPNRDTDDFRNDFTTNELANGNGYATGGVTLTTVATTYDSSSDEVRLDSDDVTWNFTASKTWQYGIWFIETAGADSTDPVILLLSWDSSQSVSTDYTLTMPASGLAYLDTT